jgi:hypothetical protein
MPDLHPLNHGRPRYPRAFAVSRGMRAPGQSHRTVALVLSTGRRGPAGARPGPAPCRPLAVLARCARAPTAGRCSAGGPGGGQCTVAGRRQAGRASWPGKRAGQAGWAGGRHTRPAALAGRRHRGRAERGSPGPNRPHASAKPRPAGRQRRGIRLTIGPKLQKKEGRKASPIRDLWGSGPSYALLCQFDYRSKLKQEERQSWLETA